MSSSNNKPISNPYARKKPPPPASSSTTTTTSATTQRPRPREEEPARTFTTFSQAFETVEDSEQYRQEIMRSLHNKNHHNKAAVQQQQKERAQQRAFEASLLDKHDNSQQQQISTETTISDRDHHILLQQPHVLYISTRQRGNGIIPYIRNVPTVYSKMVPDYVMGTTRCALFLSCKYHNMHKDYIHKRLAELKTDFTLRVLLVLVDMDDNTSVLQQLNTLAVTHDMTLILAWSEEEAARYLETFKAFDGKDASLIQRKEKTAFGDQVSEFLATTAATKVNKTDAAQLLAQFTNIRSIAAASMDELGVVSGMGQVKVKGLYDALHKPFRASSRKKQKQVEEELEEEEDDDESAILENESSELAQDTTVPEQVNNNGDENKQAMNDDAKSSMVESSWIHLHATNHLLLLKYVSIEAVESSMNLKVS